MLQPLSFAKRIYLVIRTAILPVLVAGLLLKAAISIYSVNPGPVDQRRFESVDHMIVRQQVVRLEALQTTDIAFVGDSSCLMGVVPSILEKELGMSVSNLCTLAYLGPRSYAGFIDKLAAKNAPPKAIVVMIHPVQFPRHPSWEGWISYAEGLANTVPAQQTALLGGIDRLRAWLAHVLYTPLPGVYARFYGSDVKFRDFILERKALIDPNKGLNRTALKEFDAHRDRQETTVSFGQETFFETPLNDAFIEALSVLRGAVDRFGAHRVYVAVSPIPPKYYTASYEQTLPVTQGILAHELGIDRSHVLASEPYLEDHYFSSSTHLNRFGRILFSQSMTQTLRSALSSQ